MSRPIGISAGAKPPLPETTAARALLTGAEVASAPDLPPAYAVAAFRSATPSGAAEVASLLRTRAGALSLLSPRGGYVLLPCPVSRHAGDIVRDLHSRIGDGTWMGVSWGRRADLPHVRATAADVVTVVLASARDDGVYELRDVLTDVAVLRQPSVSARLVRMIQPVVDRPQLLEALRAFLDEDGNRAGAARRLLIHRSTLDYRLRAIERLTGARPTSPLGVLTLDAALTAHALVLAHPFLPPL
ncbi:hypothetical protein FKR81_18450 [Lentzea tibetensis]|uniref:PucR C-terminal helix-turn-helix domain-containing protein n=1 Tax=Lentzea tibetensis TaxID=2591470 RepID=A0A563ETN4_9PSEU|nr:helix-turn-helix domain-containing protein [Lentzea tibetensis]TWP51049.1 hypothetical protein FKR81_18450 [Lentzea tibetensis]